jgi:hypothetical protein
MKKKVTIPYFPTGIKYATPLLILVGAYLIFNNSLVWGIILVLLSAVILTTNYVTEIDLKEKKFSDYLSLLGVGMNKETRSFSRVDQIIITKGNYSQTVNTRLQSRQHDWSDYTASLIFDGEHSLDLLTKNNKRDLLIGVKEFATFLNVEVEDRTTPSHFKIDLARI